MAYVNQKKHDIYFEVYRQVYVKIFERIHEQIIIPVNVSTLSNRKID